MYFHYRFVIDDGEKKERIFFHTGHYLEPNEFHTHMFNEFFMLEKGSIDYEIDGKVYKLTPGKMLAIPANTPHACIKIHKGDLSFLGMKSDGPIPATTVIDCPVTLVSNLIENVNNFENDSKLAVKIQALIFYLCYDVLHSDNTQISKENDYDFLIDAFMSDAKITLDKLAQKLNVTPRHAERLLMQHTGKTFNQFRLERRMSTAKSLIKKGTLSKEEIAERVGYNSYRGFAKAYKRYINENN